MCPARRSMVVCTRALCQSDAVHMRARMRLHPWYYVSAINHEDNCRGKIAARVVRPIDNKKHISPSPCLSIQSHMRLNAYHHYCRAVAIRSFAIASLRRVANTWRRCRPNPDALNSCPFGVPLGPTWNVLIECSKKSSCYVSYICIIQSSQRII